LTDFPYFLIALAIFKPYTLPTSVRMDIASNAKEIRIISAPLARGALFANLVSELKLLIDLNTFKNIAYSVVAGRNLFPIMRSFLHILARVKPEDSELVKDYEENRGVKSEAHFLKQLMKIFGSYLFTTNF